MNNYEFTFYNLNNHEIYKFICSTKNYICAWDEAMQFRNQYFENPAQWVLQNCEEIY